MEMSKDTKIHIKKDKPNINDGGHKPFGVDIDPNKNLKHITNPDGSYDAYYKDSKMDFNDYIDEMQDRCEKNKAGKDFTSRGIGLFGGFGKGTLKKPYEE